MSLSVVPYFGPKIARPAGMAARIVRAMICRGWDGVG